MVRRAILVALAATWSVTIMPAGAQSQLGYPPLNAEASFSAAANAVTPPATPTDMVTICGSATKTVRVVQAVTSTTQTTAGTNALFLVKRSTADTVGTSAAVTAIPWSTLSAAATATVLSYTANPTLGGTVGTLGAQKIFSPTVTTTPSTNPWVWFPLGMDAGPGSGVILSGTAQCLALNFAGAALPAGLSVNHTWVWTER